MVNGSRGRLELEVVESDHVSPAGARRASRARALHGAEAAAEQGGAALTVRPFWAPPCEVPVPGLRPRAATAAPTPG